MNFAILLAMAEHPEAAEIPILEMTEQQRQDFIHWLASPEIYSPIATDQDSLRAGYARVVTGLRANDD